MRRLVRSAFLVSAAAGALLASGCAASSAGPDSIAAAVAQYRAHHADEIAVRAARGSNAPAPAEVQRWAGMRDRPLTLSGAAASQPAAGPVTGGVPEGYWRRDVWRQMGHESKELITRDLWRGFKHSFWDIENALILTGAMGASIVIRESGVDGTVRNRIDGHRQLGDMDETIQILGNPGTHFAAAGALWLGSTLLQDVPAHEFARDLTQALAVNGITTLALKVSANTRAPDDEDYAWPSGHTSSAFTAAAVINEHYGPLAGIPSLALAGLVGYQRLDSQVHDFSDVVFGGFLGYVVGTSIARENRAELPEVFDMKVVPFTDPATGASGLALWKQY